MKNNKGYMLVEIILASVIAFALVFFIMDLIMKLKVKNDDLMVETLINTDRAIITNRLIEKAKIETENFDCAKLTSSGKTITYKNDTIDILNDYSEFGAITCSNEVGKVSINIPISVKQIPDKNFDATIDYKYKIGDMIPPTCSLSYSNDYIYATYEDPGENSSGISYYGWDSNYVLEKENNKNITDAGEYTYYVTDRAGNLGTCSMDIKKVISKITYTCNRGASSSYLCQSVQDAGQYAFNVAKCSTTGNNLTANCHGICLNDNLCVECPPGYHYDHYLGGKCAKGCYNELYCPSGTLNGSSCYLYNRDSCPSDWNSESSTSYTCPDGYTKAGDNKYCYK